MVQAMTERIDDDETFATLIRALESGLIVVDSNGEVVWLTEEARRGIDGLRDGVLAPRKEPNAVYCFLSTVDVPVNGHARTFCVLQVADEQADATRDLHNMIDSAIEDVMAEPAWFTRPLAEKIKAWFQAVQPADRAMDIEMLTAREREILALLCEGRGDAEMGRILGLSQNTVRNHVASLFRKIGVNRRSAAIIWARERGITRFDVAPASRTRRLR